MKKTTNFSLNQWEATDPIRREDFNADNSKIDAILSNCGNCSVAAGKYTGSGTFGENSPNTLTFEFEPKLIMIPYTPYAPLFIFAKETDATVQVNNVETVREVVSWSEDGKTVSWYNKVSALNQLNFPNQTYFYIAWG